ncbi:2'-O-glycosyltransferase CruG [Almyronema epifaneia]|uniref:4,4'-diaponeurosporenoate glycosyltransferase n=1 Tax=Almyronema epifaneia S1 TaxID=2991925 RepID=A0ABW6I9L2_9CYAN
MQPDFDGVIALSAGALLVLAYQLPAVALLLARLMQGPTRQPPLQPQRPTLDLLGTVSVIVPTLNEVGRVGPCLAGLGQQTYEVREILVVDSHSDDGTPDLVKSVAAKDPRVRLLRDAALPPDWVGRPWALQTGFLHSDAASRWILGIDADTYPQPGLVAALVRTAETQGYDLVSLAPRFILKHAGELWLQPALLMTLIYRFGPAGNGLTPPERVMANGQCFLCRQSLLVEMGGYSSARRSFCDDVTLARQAAAHGAKVGFLDGAHLLKVRMYEGAAETWREWGRSLDLKDAASAAQKWGDLWFLSAVQGLPWLLLPLLMASWCLDLRSPVLAIALGLNLSLILIRIALNFAIAASYDFSQAQAKWAFWLSPLADLLAVYRIYLSSTQTPTQWRGRRYQGFAASRDR